MDIVFSKLKDRLFFILNLKDYFAHIKVSYHEFVSLKNHF